MQRIPEPWPADIAVDAGTGHIWYLSGSQLVHRTRDGVLLSSTPIPGVGTGAAARVGHIEIDVLRGDIWTTYGNTIHRFDRHGIVQRQRMLPDHVSAITLDTVQGGAWVISGGDIHRIERAGEAAVWPGPGGDYLDIAFDAARDELWAVRRHEVERRHRSGALDISHYFGDLFNARRVVPDGTGGAWVAGRNEMAHVMVLDAIHVSFTPFEHVGAPVQGPKDILDLFADPQDASIWVAGYRHLRRFSPAGELLADMTVPGDGELNAFGRFVIVPPQPALLFEAPAPGALLAETKPEIRIAVTSVGAGLDMNSLVLAANEMSIAADCTLESTTITCVPEGPLPEGQVTLVASVADVNGWVSQSATVVFTVDTEGPTVRILQPRSGVMIRPDTAFELALADEGSGTDADSLELFVNGESALFDCSVSVGAATCMPVESFTTLTVAITVTVRDMAGNVSPPADSYHSLDTDGDGIADAIDAFPDDENEWADQDGDDIGDNSDADVDGDGVDNVEDVFPFDSDEWADLDDDGIGDNADLDRDGDGHPNQLDAFPDDPTEWNDLDGDGIGDNADPDRDGDDVDNDADLYPDNGTEWADLDGDGIGDNADTDRDGDGVNNDDDRFPRDPAEWADLDGDSVGDNADPDLDGDGVDNDADAFPVDAGRWKIPVVRIFSPDTLTTVGTTPLLVKGTVDEPDTVLTVNGLPVENQDGSFEATVSLVEGFNSVVVRAVDLQGSEVTASLVVSLDTTPPNLTIQAPEDGVVVHEETIAVTGLVNDIVRGTVAEQQANVTVNGIPATVSNRSYLAEAVPLSTGENLIEIRATDAVGNVATKQIHITYQPIAGPRVRIVSGQGQRANILGVLPEPLTVKLTGDGQVPIAGKTLVFRVIQGDGMVGEKRAPDARAFVATTDAQGIARAFFQLGGRAGQGNHRVVARAVGVGNQVTFHASADPNPGNKISVISGNNQRGATHSPLPAPFVVAVTDQGGNLVANAPVEFRVAAGAYATFHNGETVYTTTTDSDGRASAHLTLGKEAGFDIYRATATLVDTDARAGFTASALVPGDPGNTRITGMVLDNQDAPIEGVTLRIKGTTRQAVTGDDGRFIIENVPVGPVHILVDGSTTTREGEWPTLAYDMVTVAGAENPFPQPIYLLPLDMQSAATVGSEDVTLTLPEVPGFALEIEAGSVTFPDGAKTGRISVTAVNTNKIPMPPPNGMQPQFIVTIQPVGARFDPPARLTLPNTDGYASGAEVEMFSYNHELEEFVTIGWGTVSQDGSVIRSNEGVGVIQAGWHCGAAPDGSGCGHSCDYCEECDGNCNCELVPDRPKQNQQPDDCKTLLCDGSWTPADESASLSNEPKNCSRPYCSNGSVETENEPGDLPDGPDMVCQKCEDESPEPDLGKNGTRCSSEIGQECYVCKKGKCEKPDCDASKSTTTVALSSSPGFSKLSQGIIKKINDFKIGGLNWFKAEVKATFSGSKTTGEECCKDCRDPVTPVTYDEYKGQGKLTGTVLLIVPGLGLPVIRLAPTYVFGIGYLSGEIVFGLFVEGILETSASISYRENGCDHDGDCTEIKAGTTATLKGGATGRIEVKLAETGEDGAPALLKASGLAESRVQTTLGIEGSAYVGNSDCPAGRTCVQAGPFSYVAEATVEINIGIIKFDFKVSEEVVLWDGYQQDCD